MLIVTEQTCQEVIGRPDAFEAVEKVFAAMARGDAYNFPVIREAIGYADALYGFKSGFDRTGLALGVKSGGYWPGNMDKGLTNHQSTVFLFDPDTGRLAALVGGNYTWRARTLKYWAWLAPATRRGSSSARLPISGTSRRWWAGTAVRESWLIWSRRPRKSACPSRP
jgi:hypothetical protein